jgi:SAM-dependent methyltransferase
MAFLARLRRRHLRPEWMDQPDLDEGRHRDALRGLERINRWSGSARILWPALARLAGETPGRPCRVLDVATGGGDVPRALGRRARRAGVPLTLAGCDVSPIAVAHARHKAAEERAAVTFFALDVLREPLPPGYDAVISSLFLHHLSEEQATALLRRMADAARLVLVNDLVRSRTGYLLAWVGTRVLSRSPVVHLDGPRSVEGAFTPGEALALAEEAGLTGATVCRRWPCRFLLSWRRPGPEDRP